VSKDNQNKSDARKGAAKSKQTPGFIVALIVIVAVGIAAGVVAGVMVNRRGGDSSSGLKPPEFAYASTAPKGAVKAYQFALDRPDLLSQVPCYCGCGQEAGHTSNLDCFVRSRNGNEITFDDHASY